MVYIVFSQLAFERDSDHKLSTEWNAFFETLGVAQRLTQTNATQVCVKPLLQPQHKAVSLDVKVKLNPTLLKLCLCLHTCPRMKTKRQPTNNQAPFLFFSVFRLQSISFVLLIWDFSILLSIISESSERF